MRAVFLLLSSKLRTLWLIQDISITVNRFGAADVQYAHASNTPSENGGEESGSDRQATDRRATHKTNRRRVVVLVVVVSGSCCTARPRWRRIVHRSGAISACRMTTLVHACVLLRGGCCALSPSQSQQPHYTRSNDRFQPGHEWSSPLIHSFIHFFITANVKTHSLLQII